MIMNKVDDIDLIRRFKNGDRSSFEELVLKYQDRIYNLCRHILGNAHDAEDAAQDVFIKAYRNLENFKPEAALYTWLYRIGVNTCIDYKRKSPDLIRNNPSLTDERSPERNIEAKDTAQLIKIALAKLPEKLKAAIVLREIEGLSYEEIAEILNTSIGTVKSRISRARESLRSILNKRYKKDGTIVS